MIEHSGDFRRVKRICDYPISISREVIYLIEVVDGQDLGVWLFHPYKDGLSVHVTLGAENRGKKAANSARDAFEWIFNHCQVNIIYAVIPPEKKNVRTLAQVVGFEFTGDDEHGNRVYTLERVPAVMRKAS